MSPTALLNPYHIAIIKSPLTRNIGAQFDDLREEVIAALDQHIPVSDGEFVVFPYAFVKLTPDL